jgi:hypothetical protein
MLRRLLAPPLLAWACLVPCASAQVAAGASPAALTVPAPDALPFVDISGVVRADLRRSAVEQVLGPPRESPDRLLLSYPEQGLSFSLAIGDAGSKAPVRWMTVSAPSRAETFGGLRIGLAQAAAVELIQQDYHVILRTEDGGSANRPAAQRLQSLRVTDRARSTNREVEVHFAGGQVARMVFTTQNPEPFRSASRARLSPQHQVIAAVGTALALVAIFSGRSIVSWRTLRPRPASDRSGPWGAAVLLAGAVVAWQSWASLRDGQGWGNMLGVVGFVAALGLGLLGLCLMAQSSARLWAWPAKGLLALLVLAQLAEAMGWLGG